MPLSTRARALAESATMRVTRRAAELRSQGRTILDLSAGQPDFPSPPVAVEAARQALADGHTRYTPAAGLAALRSALAERFANDFGAHWQVPNTAVTVGAKAALFELMQVLIGPGDEVIIPTPAWVSFEEQVRFAGGTVTKVELDASDGFTLHAQPILDAFTERTRMVLINSPSNPTGGTISAEDLRRIAEHCQERGVVLLCDETYERFLYDGEAHASGASLATEFEDTVVLVGSFSKTYAMTGWRVGYALGPRPIISKLIDLQSHATSNPTTFAMYGALVALRDAEPYVATMLEAFTRRRAAAVKALEALDGVSCQPPSGAFYVFPKIDSCAERGGSMALAEILLERASVAVVPGLAFGDDNHLRLSFACGEDTLAEAVRRMGEVLSSERLAALPG